MDDYTQDNNTDMDQVANEISSPAPSQPIGLGFNPSAAAPSFPPLTSDDPVDPTAPAQEPISAPVPEPDVSRHVSEPIHTADVSAPTDLQEIKQHALEELTPLVSQLDQTPEEKYKTVMMLIQASDNPELVQEAYKAAHQIEDEKVKAEALLNIVNEINYLSQANQS